MKKIKFILLVIFCVASVGVLQSCRHASKYADDAINKVDDLMRNSKGPKKAPRLRTCNKCNGSGKVYDAYGNVYKCKSCVGSGKVIINF